jgi:hypothetical protein
MYPTSRRPKLEFEQHSPTPPDVTRCDVSESRLEKHSLRCNIVIARRCREDLQSKVLTCDPAQRPQSRGGHTTTGRLLANAITNPCRPIGDVVEVEAAHDYTVLINERVKDPGSGLLFGDEFSVPLRVLLEEGVASVADRFGKVCAILSLKCKDHRLMLSADELQLEHSPSLFSRSSTQGTATRSP